jgi:hypothetical protein
MPLWTPLSSRLASLPVAADRVAIMARSIANRRLRRCGSAARGTNLHSGCRRCRRHRCGRASLDLRSSRGWGMGAIPSHRRRPRHGMPQRFLLAIGMRDGTGRGRTPSRLAGSAESGLAARAHIASAYPGRETRCSKRCACSAASPYRGQSCQGSAKSAAGTPQGK